MSAMADFSIVDALETLCTSIPLWNARLDELNSQIASRQIELARLEEPDRPPTRSIKHKGSTESLRHNDGDENPFSPKDAEAIPINPFEIPKSPQTGASPIRRSSSSIARAAVTSAPLARVTSIPRDSTGAIAHQTSKKSPPQAHQGRNVLRKRKTESLASGESAAPRYRTRSMIIVYYDSAVQNAFEELVKFISVSRNSMRKGKTAAKMAEMKQAAETELQDEEDEEDGADDDFDDFAPSNSNLHPATKKLAPSPVRNSPDGADADDAFMPKLNFVSTRRMGPGPSRDHPDPDNVGNALNLGILRGFRRGTSENLCIFDELDKGLEWSQSQCEHGAHQFLRDGECNTEIINIKKKLAEVKESAEKELERIKTEEGTRPDTLSVQPLPKPPGAKPRGRELRQPILRRERDVPKELEVDDMEVDDEAVEDVEMPTKLVFKRSGDV
ncbi:hypothetical protein BJ875DRAFT_467030 [Amylocarpus encephaloides]|uniref:Uncharacterized protein n=1 Tax=Amylocarpus encephaloides TaxID=45428 RepID=A0A9P7YEP7_9HELO|nr:hypothetical protein BJ875DRAFT_467030 [Amylocarpus encephaloides]